MHRCGGWRLGTSGLAGFGLALCIAPRKTGGAAPFKCPHVGGNFVFGQEANINSLDQMTSNTISTRNIAMNIFETLVTRDENNNIIPQISAKIEESPDHLTYSFPLRTGIHFQNGKEMTSADVVASFDRYNEVGLERSMFENVDHWDAPDKATFVIHMRKAQPTFLTLLSAFSVPVIIIPAEDRDVPAQQLKPVGTGPYMLVQSVPGSYVKLKRFDGYSPDTRYESRTGFGGYKQACFDTVTFRIVTEPGARTAGLVTGELQGDEDVPVKSVPALEKNTKITLLPLPNWLIDITDPNTANPPTNNLDFRKAVQAVLDMAPILQAATDGSYRLNVGFYYPGRPGYTDAAKDTYNLHDPVLAKQYLAKSGYKGEPVILLTNHDYPLLYNSAVVMQQQLRSIGINAELKVTDWPTSVQIQRNQDTGWNFFFTGWGTQPALGPLSVMQFFAQSNPVYHPPKGHPDPELLRLWNAMNTVPDAGERQKAFAEMQEYALDQVYAIPFGSVTLIQAVRSDVKGFVPFRIPRMYNVWFEK